NDLPRPSRRDLLALSAAGVAGASLSGWLGLLAEHAPAAPPPPRHKSCIVLWMDGGPRHPATLHPQPAAPPPIPRDPRPIPPPGPGLRVSEKFPKPARLTHPAAVLRGMATEEADHGRARAHLHTGYRPGAGGVAYPVLGATASAELGDPDFPPNFVVTGGSLG